MTFVAIIFFAFNSLAMEQYKETDFVGKTAPEFSLKDINGDTINSSEFLGKKPVVIFFWATWCPHCRTAIKHLNDIYPELKAKGAELITIDLGEKANRVTGYLKTYNYNLITLLDENSTTVDSYGVVGVPTFFILNSQGTIKFKGHALPEDYISLLFKD